MVLSVYFWLFVALAPIVYWLLPQAVRLSFFAACGAVIIAVFDPLSAGLLAVIVATIHFGVRLHAGDLQRSSRWLIGTAVVVLAALIAFKLGLASREFLAANFGLGAWLPLGISYFSFKAIHFVIEFQRGRIERYSLPLFASYMFIPTAFSAGPIQRYDRFVAEMSPQFELTHVSDGLTRVAYGLIKQFVIVGMVINIKMAPAADVAEHAAGLSTGGLWVYLTLYYLTLYLNFSAYTDIAIGTSRLFGFRIMENFNFPILAKSIDEFWRRWHMTLTTWCREYVYQPVLGLWRRPMIASYATFIVIGLWHEFSLSRLLWGLLHGSALVGYFAWKRRQGTPARRRRPNAPRTAQSVTMDVLGWAATQLFVIVSMCALVIEGNDLALVGRLFLRLFFVSV